MAGLVTIAIFKETFGFHKDVKDERLERPLAAASRRIRSWVGDAVYGATDQDVKADLEFAEANLAMHFLVANLNSAIRAGGMVKSEKVEGNSVLTYLSPNDTAARAQEFFDLAEEICRPLRGEIEAAV